MVKARLPEAQFPAVLSTPPGTTSITGAAAPQVSVVDLATFLRQATTSEVVQGNEWATYVALAHTGVTGAGDCLRGASPTATEPP